MTLESRLRRLEELAADIADAPQQDDIERLLEAEGDPIKTRWRWLVLGRYLALTLLAAGKTPAGDLAEIGRELSRLEVMHPLAVPMARQHLIHVGLFDAGELAELDEFAPHPCTA